jgi:subtilisin-like proprotein convertase family protein
MTRFVALFLAALALPARAADPDLRLEFTRESLLGTHQRYRQFVDGVPVIGGEMNVSPDRVRRNLVDDSARPRAREQANGTGGLLPLNWNGTLRFVRRVVLAERPLEPVAYIYDAETNELLYRQPLYFNAKPARVFDPNPVATLNDVSLRDQNDAAAAVPSQAYRAVTVPDELNGPFVRLTDLQQPRIAPPGAADSFLFDREQDGFEDVNAYFHIDGNQRYLQSLGYTGTRAIAGYAVPVDAHAASGSDNSFFLPSAAQAGFGTLFFGEGGTDDAEDADLLIHEYGHVLLEWIAPGTFAGTFASQARAISEGFGDYWAFSAHFEQRRASGRDPFCFADWDTRCWEDDASQQCSYPPGSDCLRRLDSTRTMADYEPGDGSGVEHRNGQIWSSALREIHVALVARDGAEAGRRTANTIVLESLFGTPPQPTFAAIAERMLDVDRLLNNSANAGVICSAMSARGILTAGTCGNSPRGELTHFQSSVRDVAIPENNPAGIVATLTITDPRIIERIGVRVDVQHPSRGDLRITLIAPDGTEMLLQNLSFERAADVHTTYGIDVAPAQPLDILRGRSAAGVWQLRVVDQRALDTGRLLSWALVIQFAGDAPAAVRPGGTGPRQMIPVVGYVVGATGQRFTSEVRLANVLVAPVTATLIFTPSVADGRTSFAAVNVQLAARQTVAFADIVQSLFLTAGTGSLEVIGDVRVATRTATFATNGGTYGQDIPAGLETTAVGEPALIAAPLGSGTSMRVNLGFTETAGGTGIVRVERDFGGGSEYPILPYSHVQIPLFGEEVVRIHVGSGDARVLAYVSIIDAATGDPWFVAAQRQPQETRRVVAPAITSSRWRSDLWLIGLGGDATTDIRFGDEVRPFITPSSYLDVLADPFGLSNAFGALVADLPPATLAQTRVAADGVSQGVPFQTLDDTREQQLPWIENTSDFRTNVGIVTDGEAVAEAIIYDGAGNEIERLILVTDRGAAQAPVSARVSAGRALVRILSGRARAYASVIDNRSGDATFLK